jgi:hypothetical protein
MNPRIEKIASNLQKLCQWDQFQRQKVCRYKGGKLSELPIPLYGLKRDVYPEITTRAWFTRVTYVKQENHADSLWPNARLQDKQQPQNITLRFFSFYQQNNTEKPTGATTS